MIKFKLDKNIFNAPESLQELNFKFLHQLEFGTNFNFHPLRKATLQKTNLALTDQIQTWQKVQSNAPDKFSKVEFKFSVLTDTWHEI